MHKEKKPTDIEIGKRLRALRLKKDVSEQDVAKAIQRNASTYSRFESGSSTLSDHLAELLADYYEVDIQEIKQPKESLNIENSFHNRPTSGNINSVLVPEDMMKTMFEQSKAMLPQSKSIQELTNQNNLLLTKVFERLGEVRNTPHQLSNKPQLKSTSQLI